MIKLIRFKSIHFRLSQFISVALLLIIGSVGIAQDVATTQTPAQEAGAIQASSLGNTKNVHRLDDLIFSGQFTQEDVAKIKDEKVARVISLRTEGEVDWDEESAVKSAGMDFINVPFLAPETLTDEVFEEIRGLLKDDGKKTLFHCGSASRVGGVWLPYRVLDQGVTIEKALAEAIEIGLKTAYIQEKALDYIKRKQATPVMAGESSVKPGVNKSFSDPNLDVDSYVKRFEIESREVFLNREKVLSACDVEKGDTVADVGAGTGLFTRLFSVAVGDEGWVYAVDIAPRFLSHINAEAAKQKLTNISGVLCAENSINLPPSSADVVFICDTYHHFEFPKSTLDSIKRALKEDGHLILIDFDRIQGKTREWLMGHVRAGKDVFQSEVEAAGFTLVEEKQIDGFKENYFLKFRKN